MGVLIAGSSKQMEAEAVGVVDDYLEAIEDERYSAAYNLLCGEKIARQSFQSFAREMGQDPIVDHTVDSDVSTDSDDPSVTVVQATVVYEVQGTVGREYLVTGTLGSMAVCGQR